MDGVRSRIKSIYHLAAGTEVFLCPSGSDAEYIPLLIAKTLNKGKKVLPNGILMHFAALKVVYRSSTSSPAIPRSDQARSMPPVADTFRVQCPSPTPIAVARAQLVATRWRVWLTEWRRWLFQLGLTGALWMRRTRYRKWLTVVPRRGPCPSSTASSGPSAGPAAITTLPHRHSAFVRKASDSNACQPGL